MGARARGTVEIQVGPRRYECRLGFEALCEFEEQTGASAFEALDQIRRGAIRIKILAAAVWAGIGGAGVKDRPALSVIGEQVMLDGLANYIMPVAELLTASVTSDAEFQRFRKSMDKDAAGNAEPGASAPESSGLDVSPSSSPSITSP